MSDMGDQSQQRQLQECQFALMKQFPGALVEPSCFRGPAGDTMQFRVSLASVSEVFTFPFPIPMFRGIEWAAEELGLMVRKKFPPPAPAPVASTATVIQRAIVDQEARLVLSNTRREPGVVNPFGGFTPEQIEAARSRMGKLRDLADGTPALDRIADALERVATALEDRTSPETPRRIASWLANTFGKPGNWYEQMAATDQEIWKEAAGRLLKIVKEGVA